VIADDSGKWARNGLRFATQDEAERYVADLKRRWWAVTETRTVPSNDPVTHRIDAEGVMIRVG
jgi:hypothetical protein